MSCISSFCSLPQAQHEVSAGVHASPATRPNTHRRATALLSEPLLLLDFFFFLEELVRARLLRAGASMFDAGMGCHMKEQ